MNEGAGIQGFKKSDFVAPEQVLGEGFSADDLPPGVRGYIRERAAWPKQLAQSIARVYRLESDGGIKEKKVYVGKILNRLPEEDEIAEQFGPGSYIWIMKFPAADGKEAGLMSDRIEIDEEQGRAAHQAWKRRQGTAESTPAASPAAAPAPFPVASQMGAADILQIMVQAEDRAWARMERMAAIMKSDRPDNPADVLKTAYEGASAMMQKAVETNLGMVKAVQDRGKKEMQRELSDADDQAGEGDGEEEAAIPGVPEWLAPFIPQIKPWLEKLLSGGPAGAAVKTLILSSDQWREVFQDKDKWEQAVGAMRLEFGEERTERALNILLNRRPPAPPPRPPAPPTRGKKGGK
jgi:hypothetical protein